MRQSYRAAAIATGIIGTTGGTRVALAEPPIASPPQAAGQEGGHPIVMDQSALSAAASANRFGLSLFQNCAHSTANRNLFLSPASVYFALSMVYNGAGGGATAASIAKTLQFPTDDQDLTAVNASNHALSTSILATRDSNKVTLSMANAIWADQGVHFAPDFIARIKADYGGETSTLNFRSPEAAAAINGWAAKNTQGKITSVLTPSDLRNATDAVLTNAVYFKGLWNEPFAKARTADAPFHRPASAGGDKTTPMMRASLRVGYLHSDDFDAVRLPYGDGRFAMYAFLPSAASDLGAFIGHVTPENWKDWQKSLLAQAGTSVEVHMPRFKVSYEASLKEPLTTLGMRHAFSRAADFRPMGLAHNAIDDVRHKAVLEVNEEGSEAAAVTTVLMSRTAVMRRPREIIFDRPFFCAICDDQTGALLFVGAVNDPE